MSSMVSSRLREPAKEEKLGLASEAAQLSETREPEVSSARGDRERPLAHAKSDEQTRSAHPRARRRLRMFAAALVLAQFAHRRGQEAQATRGRSLLDEQAVRQQGDCSPGE